MTETATRAFQQVEQGSAERGAVRFASALQEARTCGWLDCEEPRASRLEMARGLVAASGGAGEVGGTGRMVADEHGIFF